MSIDKEKLDQKWNHYLQDFKEFAQGPSDFQIEVFMGRGEGPPDILPEHAYRHMLAQIKPCISELRRLEIDGERLQRKKKRLEKKIQEFKAGEFEGEEYEDADLDLLIIEQEITENEIARKGKEGQYETMNQMLTFLKETHGEMTDEKLQEKEPVYWLVRLARQMIDAVEGNMTGIGSGNINSVRNAVMGSFLPESKNQIPIMQMNADLLKELANGNPQAIHYALTQDANMRKELKANNATPPAVVLPPPSPEQKKEGDK